jgi:hypothetical protein
MDADINAEPAAARAAGARTARQVRFESADDTAAGTSRKDEHGSGSGAALLDWCCPDIEALLASMPAVQQARSSSSSEVQSGDKLAQHAALCR